MAGLAPNLGNFFHALGQGTEKNIGKPTNFHGKRNEDAEEWHARFI